MKKGDFAFIRGGVVWVSKSRSTIYLSDEQKNGTLVTLNISKGQLAGLLGTIPETLSRIFAKMTDQDLIEVKGRNIRLLNRTGLEELAGHC